MTKITIYKLRWTYNFVFFTIVFVYSCLITYFGDFSFAFGNGLSEAPLIKKHSCCKNIPSLCMIIR